MPDDLRLCIQHIGIGERSKRYSRSGSQGIRIVCRDIGAADGMMQEDEEKPYIRPQVKPEDGKMPEIIPHCGRSPRSPNELTLVGA